MGGVDEAFLRGLAGPAHWTEGDARRVLAAWAASGLGRASFARRYGLRATRIAWWEKRLGEWRATETLQGGTSEEEFVELVALPAMERVSRVHGGDVAARVRVADVAIELVVLDEAAARFVAEVARLRGRDACC
jgi:hypothetical protein